jgi:hypothetical protein
MVNIKTEAFLGFSILEGDKGTWLTFRAESGEQVNLEVAVEDLMQVTEATSRALTSIGLRSPDGVQHAEVSGGNVRLPAGPEVVAIEFAFGQEGHLYFGLPTPVAKGLHAKLGKALETIEGIQQRPN